MFIVTYILNEIFYIEVVIVVDVVLLFFTLA